MTNGAQGKTMLAMREVAFYYKVRRSLLRRDKIWALNGVSLELKSGEALGIVGRNGSGKSTLLRLLAGIFKPDRGTISTDGHSVSMLSLGAGFIPYLTGRENVILSGLTLGMKKGVILDRLGEIEEFAEIGEYFDRPTSSYSTGMRARLGFSIAFQLDPDILLIDEVFGVGDTGFQDKSSRMMRKKIRAQKSVIMVAHNALIVRRLCDRAIILNNGEVEAVGEVNEVMDLYASKFSSRSSE